MRRAYPGGAGMRVRGDVEMWRCGDVETGRRGDGETGETGRRWGGALCVESRRSYADPFVY